MSVRLDDTTAGEVSGAINLERFRQGSSAVNRVLTLVIVADEDTQADAVVAGAEAAREHPCRILTAIPRPGKTDPRLDAVITVGGGDGLGELVELRLRGHLSQHIASVVLPLLVPDSPVVVWWPGKAPAMPAEDPVGRLAQRRITDAAASARPLKALAERLASYREGDTDLAWTRITPWRALLAANLDQPHDPITGCTVEAERNNASATLLGAWLHGRLGVPVRLKVSKGPGITAVAVHTTHGDITISRPSGGVAHLTRPGFPDREAALARRTAEGLIAEELRRLDPDEVYGETLAAVPALDAQPPLPVAAATMTRPSKAGPETPAAAVTPGPGAAPRTSAKKATTTAVARTTATKKPAAKKPPARQVAAKKPATPRAAPAGPTSKKVAARKSR
jgi:glucose-6-phosphate dehydrogenase assembly protein OpcA